MSMLAEQIDRLEQRVAGMPGVTLDHESVTGYVEQTFGERLLELERLNDEARTRNVRVCLDRARTFTLQLARQIQARNGQVMIDGGVLARSVAVVRYSYRDELGAGVCGS